MPVDPANVESGRNGRCDPHAVRDCHACQPPDADDLALRDLLVRGLRPGTITALDRIATAAGVSRAEYLRRLLVAAAGR